MAPRQNKRAAFSIVKVFSLTQHAGVLASSGFVSPDMVVHICSRDHGSELQYHSDPGWSNKTWVSFSEQRFGANLSLRDRVANSNRLLSTFATWRATAHYFHFVFSIFLKLFFWILNDCYGSFYKFGKVFFSVHLLIKCSPIRFQVHESCFLLFSVCFFLHEKDIII